VHRQNQLKEVMQRAIKAYRLLIIDEIGYLPMNRDQANLFFKVIAALYERSSLIVTSNLSFGQWDTTSGGALSGGSMRATARSRPRGHGSIGTTCILTREDRQRPAHRAAPVEVLEQPRRTGSPSRQTSNPADARVQGFPLGRQAHCWHRDHAHDQEGAARLPPRPARV
jgi:hypothetical protein